MTTGQIIKRARQAAGVTQQELADRLGIKAVGVSQWETDKRNPKKETLARIAEALDVPMAFLGGADGGPDKIIPDQSLQIVTYRMLQPVIQNLMNAQRDHDEDSIKFWGNIASELNKIQDEVADKYFREFTEETEQMIELLSRLNDTGKARALEWVSDICKIPEYQNRA